MNLHRFLILFISITQIIGCGRFTEFLDDVAPDTKKDYLKARTLPDLSIPPELSSATIKDKMFIPDSSGNVAFENFNERRIAGEQPVRARENDSKIFELGKIEDRPVLLAKVDRDTLWNSLRRFWQSQNELLVLDDLQLGIMETSWVESKDKLTRQRFKIYTEQGKGDYLNIVFAVCERQELETVNEAYGEDYVWGPTKRIVQEELNLMSRLRDNLLGGRNLIVDNQRNDYQKDIIVAPKQVNQRIYTSGGAKFFKNKPYRQTDSNENEQKLADNALVDPYEEQMPVVKQETDISLREFKTGTRDFKETKDFENDRNNVVMNMNSERVALQSIKEDNASNFKVQNPQVVSVGRGNYYLTVENNYSYSWKLVERAIRRSGMGIRQADKSRGVFVVNMSENNLDKESIFSRAKFWGGERSSQFQVSLTGIGDKTEIVILDKEGKWLTNQRSERLLDRLYNTLAME